MRLRSEPRDIGLAISCFIVAHASRATTNLLDECIDRHLSIRYASRPARSQATIRNRLKFGLLPGRRLTVDLVRALSDLDDIAVRIADVAANLAVLGDRLRDELGSSTFP